MELSIVAHSDRSSQHERPAAIAGESSGQQVQRSHLSADDISRAGLRKSQSRVTETFSGPEALARLRGAELVPAERARLLRDLANATIERPHSFANAEHREIAVNIAVELKRTNFIHGPSTQAAFALKLFQSIRTGVIDATIENADLFERSMAHVLRSQQLTSNAAAVVLSQWCTARTLNVVRENPLIMNEMHFHVHTLLKRVDLWFDRRAMVAANYVQLAHSSPSVFASAKAGNVFTDVIPAILRAPNSLSASSDKQHYLRNEFYRRSLAIATLRLFCDPSRLTETLPNNLATALQHCRVRNILGGDSEDKAVEVEQHQGPQAMNTLKLLSAPPAGHSQSRSADHNAELTRLSIEAAQLKKLTFTSYEMRALVDHAIEGAYSTHVSLDCRRRIVDTLHAASKASLALDPSLNLGAMLVTPFAQHDIAELRRFADAGFSPTFFDAPEFKKLESIDITKIIWPLVNTGNGRQSITSSFTVGRTEAN